MMVMLVSYGDMRNTDRCGGDDDAVDDDDGDAWQYTTMVRRSVRMLAKMMNSVRMPVLRMVIMVMLMTTMLQLLMVMMTILWWLW